MATYDMQGVSDSILAVLQGVTGIGQVHDFFRLVTSEKGRNDNLVSEGRVHFWVVTNTPANAYITRRFPASHSQATYGFEIHGFYAVKDADASEKAFRVIVERVIRAFEAGDKKLGNPSVIEAGPADWIEGGGPEADRTVPPGEGGVLCHYARLSLPVRVQVEPAA